jgi:hypothetical protein
MTVVYNEHKSSPHLAVFLVISKLTVTSSPPESIPMPANISFRILRKSVTWVDTVLGNAGYM